MLRKALAFSVIWSGLITAFVGCKLAEQAYIDEQNKEE